MGLKAGFAMGLILIIANAHCKFSKSSDKRLFFHSMGQMRLKFLSKQNQKPYQNHNLTQGPDAKRATSSPECVSEFSGTVDGNLNSGWSFGFDLKKGGFKI